MLMRMGFLLVAVLLSLGSSAQAQEFTPEVFGGYALFNAKAGGDRATAHGWLADVSMPVTPTFGFAGKVGGQYSDSLPDIYEFMGGVRARTSLPWATPFAHALAGGLRASASGSSDIDFAMAFGGGVDIRARDDLSLRIVQFDWMPVRGEGRWTKSAIRLAFGVVLHVGQ
jgi:hypothetical protein